VKETDAIFDNLAEAHRRASSEAQTLRLSLDAKAPVLIGPFSRGGKSRLGTEGADHDFRPWGKLTPFGIFLPDHKELSLYFTHSKVTSDFIVDRLDQWWLANRGRHRQVRKLLLDLDNGPENSSRRWCTIRPTTASTTRSSAAGACWRFTGTGRCFPAKRRSWGSPAA
jgi:hypothetical protein